MNRVYHYTVGKRLIEILEADCIRTAEAFVEGEERPVVWLTTSEKWEPTANKMLRDKATGAIRRLSKAETEAIGNGLIRIAVKPEAAPHDWKGFLELSGVPKGVAKGLLKSAKASGSDVRAWRVSFEPIPREDWTAIEIWNGSAWVDLVPEGEPA